MSEPIFIVGTERSGSNLLRLLLDAHSKIWIPHPPHFMNYFGDLDYGDLTDNKQQEVLLNDMLRLIRYHIFPWDDIELNTSEIMSAIQHPSHFGVVAAIYETVLKQTSKSIWGCKSTFMIEYVSEVYALYPKARFIFLVRDPRDVSASAKRSVFSPCHPLLSSRLWAQQQTIGIKAMQASPAQFCLIKYEDLVENSTDTLTQVCSFLNIDLELKMLDFFRNTEAQTGAHLSESWKNTGKPIQSNNFGKWRTQLSEQEVSEVESQCFDLMEFFGYQPQASQKPSTSKRHVFSAKLQEHLLAGQIEIQSLRKDKNAFLRWRRAAYVKWLKLRHSPLSRTK